MQPDHNHDAKLPRVRRYVEKVIIKIIMISISFSGVFLPSAEYSAGRIVFYHTLTRKPMFLFVNPDTGFWEVEDHFTLSK